MKQLRFFLLIFAFFTFSFQSFSQANRGQRLQKIESARTAFLTERMNLTPEQAQKFWPVYNEFDKKRKEIKRQSRVFKSHDFDKMSDEQLKDGINAMFETRQKELNLEKDYSERLQKIITVRQLATMYKAEREFTKVLLQKLNDKRRPQE